MPQIGPKLRTRMQNRLALAAVGVLLGACGPSEQRQAEMSAAPVRHVVEALLKHPQWGPSKCLCVGQFLGETVEDYPAGLLKAEFARHTWVRNWSECAPHYGKKKGLAQCANGMTDYICSVAERADLPSGTTRVLCHVNGKNELLFDEYDVTQQDSAYVARPVSLKAFAKLGEAEDSGK